MPRHRGQATRAVCGQVRWFAAAPAPWPHLDASSASAALRLALLLPEACRLNSSTQLLEGASLALHAVHEEACRGVLSALLSGEPLVAAALGMDSRRRCSAAAGGAVMTDAACVPGNGLKMQAAL